MPLPASGTPSATGFKLGKRFHTLPSSSGRTSSSQSRNPGQAMGNHRQLSLVLGFFFHNTIFI
jgi:hypothetical protein